jgi:hypothetical protein
MPEFTDYERARLYNDARRRVERVEHAVTPEVVSHRRFIAFGVILGLTKAGALRQEQANELLALLQLGVEFEDALREALQFCPSPYKEATPDA